MLYTNAAIDFEWYSINNDMTQHLPYWTLRYQNGTDIPLTGRLTFNFANRSMSKRFTSMCVDAIRTGHVDGCFVDRSDPEWQIGWSGNTLPGDFINLTAYTMNKIETLRDMQAAAGDGPIILNCHSCIDNRALPPISQWYTNTQNIEWFTNSNASIADLMYLQQHAKYVRAHASVPDELLHDTLGAFLIAVK